MKFNQVTKNYTFFLRRYVYHVYHLYFIHFTKRSIHCKTIDLKSMLECRFQIFMFYCISCQSNQREGKALYGNHYETTNVLNANVKKRKNSLDKKNFCCKGW